MSLLSSLTKRSKLDAAIKQVSQARKSEGGKAEQLFQSAYEGFADVISGNLLFAEALYNWGFGLLHEARMQPDHDKAVEIYEDAISKFSFCLLTQPTYLGAAIDGGVAFMELARMSLEEVRSGMYHLAEQFFEKAGRIQKGSAAYNLACIHSLRGDEAACEDALKTAKEFGSLPDVDVILADPDMERVKAAAWFNDFIEAQRQAAQEPQKREKLGDVEIESEPSFKLKKSEDFDYYA